MSTEIEPVYRVIGDNIRALRRQHKLSQQDLATLLDLQRFSSVADIEHGRARIQIHTLLIVADLFDVNVQSLIAATEDLP